MLGEQHCNRHPERVGKLLHDHDGRVAHPSLDAADVSSIEPVFEREFLLPKLLLKPQSAYVDAEALANIHRPQLELGEAVRSTDEESQLIGLCPAAKRHRGMATLPKPATSEATPSQTGPVRATNVRYIKLGPGGRWERASLDRGRLDWGLPTDPHAMALEGNLEGLGDHYRGLRTTQGSVTADLT